MRSDSSTDAFLLRAAPGSRYDTVDVAGQCVLDGTLDVELLYGFRPQAGQAFDILGFDPAGLSGRFDAVNLPELGGGLEWDTSNLYSTGSIGVVPEPASAAILMAGMAGTALRRRRR